MSEHDLAELATTRGGALVGYAALLCGDRREAEDLVQDALVKVWSRVRRGEAPAAVEAYVRRTILTTYLDGYRSRRRWTGVRHLTATPESTPGPEHDLPAGLDLRAALAGLARQERAAVVLRFYADLTVPEVAREMGLADGTVKRYLANAMRKLETRLGPIDVPGGETVPVDTRPDGRTGGR